MSSKGILLCGHGSRHPDGVSGFLEMAEKIRQRHPDKIIEAGFLELSEPTFASAIDKLYEQGVRDIVAVQAFLFTGVHLRLDIPLLMNQFMDKYDGLRIRMASYVGVCDELVELACKRIAEGEAKSPEFDRREALLFGIGVGASVPDANGDLAKLNRLIWEKAGFDFSLVGFTSRMAKPSVAESANILAYFPHKTVVVLPMLFFNGVYLETAAKAIKETCGESGKNFVYCEPFQSDDLILEAMEHRMNEVIDGKVDLTQDFDRAKAEERAHNHDHHDHRHGHGHRHHGHGHS